MSEISAAVPEKMYSSATNGAAIATKEKEAAEIHLCQCLGSIRSLSLCSCFVSSSF